MATVKTVIAGFEVDLETYTDCGEPRSDCFISKRGKSASLTVAQGYGCLDPDAPEGEEVPISDSALARIEAWALKNGY